MDKTVELPEIAPELCFSADFAIFAHTMAQAQMRLEIDTKFSDSLIFKIPALLKII